MNLDSREWREFKISEICDISSGVDIYDAERKEGNIPYVTSSAQNNGIKYFVSNTNKSLDEGAISVNRNGSVGYAFYHPYKALYSNDCRKIKPKINNSPHVSIFITNQIMAQKDKYNYGYKMGTERLTKQAIMLPVDDTGEPDWEYMEDYVKSVLQAKKDKYIDYIESLLRTLQYEDIPSLHEKDWKEFFIIDIFPSIQRGKRLIKKNQKSGIMPYVSSTGLNNGIDNYIGNTERVRIFSNCLTIANSGSVGASFYHPYEFVASDHVTHFKNDIMNEYEYLFIATITNRLSEKYNFNREINDARIAREKILLPVNDLDEMDLEYMRQYMINLRIKKYQQYLRYQSTL